MSDLPEIEFQEWHVTANGMVTTCILVFENGRIAVGVCPMYGREERNHVLASELSRQDAIDNYILGNTYFLDEEYIDGC